ncbi:MAG: hypothetical protein WAO50_11905, partial [Candidatus Nanopelagicales bacterium]
LLQRLVASGELPTSYATDDRIGLLYQGTDPVEVVADLPDSTASAYLVEAVGGTSKETRLSVGPLPR